MLRCMSNNTSASATRWDRSVWGLLAVLCGVLFLDGLDVSMVGMALPSIKADLALTTSQLQWIVSGYVLGYGGFLLLGGRAADLLGRKRVLVAALAVFTVASALGGGDREDGQRGDEDAPSPEEVSRAAAEEEEAAVAEHVAGDDPLQLRSRQSEIGLDRRQCHPDHRD